MNIQSLSFFIIVVGFLAYGGFKLYERLNKKQVKEFERGVKQIMTRTIKLGSNSNTTQNIQQNQAVSKDDQVRVITMEELLNSKMDYIIKLLEENKRNIEIIAKESQIELRQ